MRLWEKARAAFAPRRLRDDYRTTFETIPGQRVLGSIFDTCGMSRPTVRFDHQGRTDPYAMARAEGRREVGLAIQEILRMDENDIRELEQSNAGQGEAQ